MSNLMRTATFCFLLCLVLGSCAASEIIKPSQPSEVNEHLKGLRAAEHPKLSISPFPYDLSIESMKNVAAIVNSTSSVYTVQLDNGIPWQEALDGAPFPKNFQRDLRNRKNAIRPGQQIYLAIAPLQDDRTSWASAFDGQKAPGWVSKEHQINDRIRKAYVNYVLRVIEYFEPQYINIGVEAGDAAHKDVKKWQSLAPLFIETLETIKNKHSKLQAGLSWSLPLLMQGKTLTYSTQVISASDYVGISFYPYMGQFYEKIGGVDLPPPPQQWREPLVWLKKNVNKPIAICETGYSSSTVSDSRYGLSMASNANHQAAYVSRLR